MVNILGIAIILITIATTVNSYKAIIKKRVSC